jgi:pSer/pThr/pTyr-binding forkhead associated (FHA) protein
VIDPHVSGEHAVVEPDAGGYRLRDLGSRHGTRVNGSLVASARLEQGDRIEIEPVTLVFEYCTVPATVLTANRSTPATLPQETDETPPTETPGTRAPGSPLHAGAA